MDSSKYVDLLLTKVWDFQDKLMAWTAYFWITNLKQFWKDCVSESVL